MNVRDDAHVSHCVMPLLSGIVLVSPPQKRHQDMLMLHQDRGQPPCAGCILCSALDMPAQVCRLMPLHARAPVQAKISDLIESASPILQTMLSLQASLAGSEPVPPHSCSSSRGAHEEQGCQHQRVWRTCLHPEVH